MELRMTTDLQQALPAEIGFNFDELKAWLTEQLHHYKTLVVTEDSIREGKEDLAKLRKLREAVETKRKDVKKQYNAPLAVFEGRIKELVALIDEPIAAIDGQVKTFDEQQREQKRSEIEAAYDKLVPDTLREIIPLNRILDPTWLNKTCTMKKVQEAILTRVKRTHVDMVLIDGIQPQYKTAVMTKYLATLDISTAMGERDRLMAAEQAIQQREAARAAYQPPVAEKPPVAAQEPVREPAQTERIYHLRLEFQLTKRQADDLKAFLMSNGITYRNITNQH